MKNGKKKKKITPTHFYENDFIVFHGTYKL